jgi:hypothetical protein
MRLFKKKKEDDAICPQHTYSMTILFNNDRSLPYTFTNVKAATSDAAVEKMKRYVATNGYFGSMSADAVIEKLSAIDVVEKKNTER